MRRLPLVLLVMGLCLPGCGKASSTAKMSDEKGTYALVTINGNKLPFAPPHEGGAPRIRSGTFTLNANGTFSHTMTYGMPSGETFSRDFSGSYTRVGSRFSFQWKSAGRTTATLEGNTLTMDNEGVLYAYRAASAGATSTPVTESANK